MTSEFNWGVLSGTLARPLVVRQVQALILSDAALPILPNRQPNPEAALSERLSSTKINFTNLERRFISIPLPTKDYSQILAGRTGKVFLAVNEWNDTPGDLNSSAALSFYFYDLANPSEMKKIVSNISNYAVTQNGGNLLYSKGRQWFLVNSESAANQDEGKLNLSRIEIKVNPAEEWQQMFLESIRIMRDWFYDPNYHGQNLSALENYYSKYLPGITRRRDLNSLIERMLGSVSVSHLGVSGGDIQQPTGNGNNIGLLGANYSLENNHYRIKKIFRSTSYSSVNGASRAPLDQNGIDVREGDYLLEVNGNKVSSDKNIYSFFENTVNKPTKITVSAKPDNSNPRTFTVYPVNRENRLRLANWAEDNRRFVDKLSNGKIGYIFVEDYGNGILNAIRGFTGYAHKEAIIIDQRFNGGGITPDYLIEWMQCKPLYKYSFRDGIDIGTPVNSLPAVKVMLINEWNGSAAETAAFMFKTGKLGSIVGKRTIGAGIGPYFFTPRLIDNGRIQLPNRAVYQLDGKVWSIENYGVEPDFDVEIMPADLIKNRDPQLEKAIQVAVGQIALKTKNETKHPKFPIYP